MAEEPTKTTDHQDLIDQYVTLLEKMNESGLIVRHLTRWYGELKQTEDGEPVTEGPARWVEFVNPREERDDIARILDFRRDKWPDDKHRAIRMDSFTCIVEEEDE